MTNKSSKLNKDDIKYMLDILQDEEERQYADIEIRENVDVARVKLERLQHIRTVLLGISEEAEEG
jgi:biotin synthase-like enzyme